MNIKKQAPVSDTADIFKPPETGAMFYIMLSIHDSRSDMATPRAL